MPSPARFLDKILMNATVAHSWGTTTLRGMRKLMGLAVANQVAARTGGPEPSESIADCARILECTPRWLYALQEEKEATVRKDGMSTSMRVLQLIQDRPGITLRGLRQEAEDLPPNGLSLEEAVEQLLRREMIELDGRGGFRPARGSPQHVIAPPRSVEAKVADAIDTQIRIAEAFVEEEGRGWEKDGTADIRIFTLRIPRGEMSTVLAGFRELVAAAERRAATCEDAIDVEISLAGCSMRKKGGVA